MSEDEIRATLSEIEVGLAAIKGNMDRLTGLLRDVKGVRYMGISAVEEPEPVE